MPMENEFSPVTTGQGGGGSDKGVEKQGDAVPPKNSEGGAGEVRQNGSSMVNGGTLPNEQNSTAPSDQQSCPTVNDVTTAMKKTDGSASFLRAARAGNLEKVLEFLKASTDINTCNANGLNALHLASKEGHAHVVSALIEKKANVDSSTKKGNTALHIASLAGQEEIVRILVENGASVNIQSQNGFTPLYMAAQENHDVVVKYLLSHGANQSLATEDGFTPLAVALQQGHDKVVAVLLENDTRGKVRLPALHIAAKKDDTKAATLLLHTDHNPDVTSKSGFTPLHIASHYGNDNIAALLIQRKADVNFVAKHQITPLHVASKWGKGNMVSLLIDKGANIESKTRDGLTPLHCAARSGHETVVDMLLEKGAPITAKTKNGLAPLHMSSQGDHVDAARILLYHKAPVDDVTVDFLTALHVAAHCGHVRVAKLLLDRKADPNARALNGFTPLHIACKKNRIKVVELLLKHGGSIEATTESGLTPLHVASFMGCMNIVIYLIQHGASADVPTVRGETPLHLAARANQTDIIRILLRNGAEVDARAREQQTALHIASRLGNSDIVVLLLQHGANVDAATKDSYTPLHIAAKEGQEEVASVLLEHGASLSATTKKGFTPLHLAAKYGNMKVARLLLQKDAAVDPQGKNGVTPLHVAAHYDHQNVALLLLDKGASPHATAKNGYTPLHIAARKNQMDIATTLLEYQANSNQESKAGFTPLHLSAQEGHSDMSTLLMEHGAEPGTPSKNGLTPLHLCSQEDRVNVGAILVKHGAEIDPKTKAGYTPLHVAAHFGQMNMVRFLLQHSCKVDAPTQLGYTPLHQAAQQGHSQIVNLLLENKAEPNMETNDGKTALSIAQRLGYISVVETLKIVTETRVTTNTTTTTEEKYKVVVPETMHETFMSESEDEGGDDTIDAYGKAGQQHVNLPYYEGQFQYTTDDTMLGDQSYRYLTVDEMKSLGDDSLPIDVTRDEKMDVSFQSYSMPGSGPHPAPVDQISPQHKKELLYSHNVDNIDINRPPVLAGFLVSFMVDARGGAMRGCRHSGVRVIIPPRKASMPMRITCRYLKKDKLVHAPPLMEGEALASRILEMGPSGAKFLGPVIIEVPHFASLRGKEREIVILRSDNGETWREHTLEATEEAVQEVLNESFDGEELKQLEDLNTSRITRVLTTDFPQYFAIVTRIRQEVHAIGPEGGMVSSTVVPQVQAVFPQGALTKKIKVGLQAQPISPDLVAKLLGNRVAVSSIVTVEPRRRKFHKPITLTIPVPQAASKGMINQYSGEAPTLRLLCSITGGTTRAQWEDVTGSTPLTFVNDCVSFTTTVSARFWLMDCTNIPEATKMATELYREAIHVPFMAKFVVFSKRHQLEEARVRVFCMTDDKEDKTLETQENFSEVAKSRDVEVLEGKSQHLEFAGNLIPVTKSGDQLGFNFYAFKENRLPFTVRVKDQNGEPAGRVAFMRQPKVGRGDPPQTPICTLNLSLPENVLPEPAPSEPDLLALEKKYTFLSINKTDTIHKADLRLSDISNMLGSDWVFLANELDINESDANIIKSQYPNNAPQQAIVMLRLWMQTQGNKATGNSLEKGLRTIGRVDIVDECISNLELVTDDIERAMATERLEKPDIDSMKPEITPIPNSSLNRDASMDVSYDEKDIMKDAESADEEEEGIRSSMGEITQASVVQIDEGSMDTSSKKVPSAAADVETPAVQASIVSPQHSQEERGTKDQTSEDEDGVSKEDVGVVFTEPKESWGGVKLPSETTSGQIHAQPIPSSHTFSPPLQDDSRPQRRHERTYSQASNIVSKNNYAASTETESSVESDIGPYSERKQFWEKVSSFESKSPFGKGETESDTDTGTDGTVIEKDLSFAEISESAHESTEKKAEGRFAESKEASIPSDIHDLISVDKKEASRDLPSPDDISLKDVKTRKEVFEKEIQNQAAAAENGWKRSSKDYSDQHGIPEQKTQSITVESSITSKDSSFLREKEIIKLRLETESDMEKIKTRENTDFEHSETTDSTSKELFSFKKVKEDEVETTTEQELKSDLRKQILEDEQENKKKTVTKSKDGLVTKSDAKETTKAYAETTHKEQDDKSQTFVKDKDGRESTVTFAEKSLHSSDRKEFHHSKAFTSHKKMRDISSEGDTSKTSSSETTESTDDSFDFNEATKKHTQAPQSHSECSTDDESKKIVEKKIEEERRTIGNIEEILVRETTTTREGDQEQRVVKETKTQETNLPDGSTVKTTSVTTFTTNLDTNDSDYSDGSSSAVLGREKLEGKLKQLSIDDVFPAELHSDELTPEDAGKKVLLSPIHIPEEENVEEVVWEVSQQVSEVLEPETVQNIPDELNAESSDISKKDNKNIDVPLKLILTEEDARKVAVDIVEEVKYEALKRSPVRITREDVADETTSFFQVQQHEEQFNELHLIESIAAKKAEMQRNKLGMTDCQLSLEITDEDLKSSYAELSPIEHQMEKLRLMTEDDDPIKAYNEPSEADESESSIIIHDCLEESFTSGYDQANKMFNQTLDALKTTSLNKVERSIDTISEESTKPELEEIDPKKRKDDLTETAMQIIKEVTEKAIESETLKQASSVKSNLAPHTDYKIKLIKDDLLKHERSLDVLMESSMTESVEECSAAESTRAYDSKFVTEFTKTTIPEMTEQEDVTVQKDKPLIQPEIVKMRKKSHIDEFNRRSGTDFDAYSSSGESHYFTAAEGTDSRSVSRPCSSDADLLLSATPGTSEYDTALTSQEGSQYTLSSQDFSTAPSSISSRDSMKSVDSESSGHLGSIELSSEASETLVPSTLDLEKDMELLDKEILEEEMMLSRSSSSNIPELTLFTGTPKSEELPSSMENDSDISEPSEEAMSPLVSSKMKRSMEMTFHPEPKVLLGEEIPITGLDESTISENSAITVIEIDKNILETSVSDTNMSSSNVSENIQLCTDTKNTSTENLPVASKVQGMDEGSTPNAVTITTTSVPSSDPDASKTTMCTQVTSEGNENSFFRTSGLAEIEKVSSQNGELIRRLAAAPATNEVGTAGSHSASPESLIIDSSKPEVDQYLEEDGISFSRKGMFFDEREDAYRNLSSSDPFERPKTPEPGSRSHLVLQSSEDTEDMTEVDKRFSAIFSVTYEEPESPSPLLKISSNSVPDITVTEHMAPVNEKHRYPDLESETEFPECFTQYGADSRTSTSPATSPKSSTTDSEHEREYCLEGQVSIPVDESFEFINVDDVYDTTEFQSTLMHHEHRLKDIAARNDRDESSDSGNIGDSPGILPVTIKAVKLDSLSPSDSENFGLDDMAKTLDDSAFNSSIEEQRRWLEMQFEENGIQSSYEFSQQNFGEHVFAGPLEDIEEERDDFERRDLSHVTKTPSLSSTPEYDVLAGRRFFTRSGDNDDISVSSLQEFETLEKVVSGEMGARRSSSGSQESLNGKQPGNGQKSAHGDDISVSSFSSLNEFERLEKECLLVEIEDKIKVEEQILSEIEEGHESQVSESESCETMSEAEEESPSNYEQKIFEIDEIIRQAQSNVENFEKEGVLLRDIVGISESTDERTPSAEPQDSLEEAAPSGEHKDKFEKSMAASTDSLESKSNMGTVLKKPDQMSASMDSLESARRDLMATSADSLGKDDSSGRDGDVSSGSERIYHRQGGPMEWSTDSLEPTSSQATHALCHYETDSMMSGSFTSGCSNTLMPTAEESSEFMSSGIYLQEGDFTEDYSDSKYDWRSGSFTEGLVREIVEESTEPEFSHTLTRTVVMPPKIEKVTFKGQDAEQQLEKYIEQFNVGEHSSETETVDAAGNVHIQRVVHKRMIIDPDVARETGLFSDTPEAPKGEPVNVESNVDQTVISISSMGIDAGKPVINTKILTSTLPSSSHISISPLSTHPSGPPSGLHSPREPPPTSLEPNTASEYSLDESTQEESK